MNRTRTTIGLFAVAAMAFAAGRSELFRSDVALAAEQGARELVEDVKNAARQQGKAIKEEVTKKAEQAPPDMEAMFAAWAKIGTPGEHHAYLEPAIGPFEGTVRFRMSADGEWMESKGVVTREWVLGKRFIRETIKGSSPMGDFNAIGFLGYNNYDGRYEFVWMEDMSTAIMMQHGTFDPEKKVMTLRSEHREPATGKLMIGAGTWDLSDPNREKMEGTTVGADGKPFKSFQGTFERRK